MRAELISFHLRQYLEFIKEIPIFESVVFGSDLYFLLIMKVFVPRWLQQEREEESAGIE